jgi:hypothetical protein
MYHIYESGLFAVGQKPALWRGIYGRDRESGLATFVERLPTLAPALADFVRLMRFHLAPLTCHTCLHRRIEAALSRHLCCQPGLVGSFQDAGIRYEPRRPSEEVAEVICESSAVLLGLPACLEVYLSHGASPYAPTSEPIPVHDASLGVSDPTNT